MTARIPMSITHVEFNEALKPLFDLLGTSGMEIVGDILIVRPPKDDTFSNYDIRFTVVARAPGSAADFPLSTLAEGHPQDDEFAIWTHQISVAVIDA